MTIIKNPMYETKAKPSAEALRAAQAVWDRSCDSLLDTYRSEDKVAVMAEIIDRFFPGYREMLEALELAWHYVTDTANPDGTVKRKIEAALRKAKGEL